MWSLCYWTIDSRKDMKVIYMLNEQLNLEGQIIMMFTVKHIQKCIIYKGITFVVGASSEVVFQINIIGFFLFNCFYTQLGGIASIVLFFFYFSIFCVCSNSEVPGP